MPLSDAELIGGAVAGLASAGGGIAFFFRFLANHFQKLQEANAGLIVSIQADTKAARKEFTDELRETRAVLARVEAHHEAVTNEALATLRTFEAECAKQRELDRLEQSKHRDRDRDLLLHAARRGVDLGPRPVVSSRAPQLKVMPPPIESGGTEAEEAAEQG